MTNFLQAIAASDPDMYNLIIWEQQRQTTGMEFIASENYQSAAVLHAQSTVFANKYAEWYPGKRYYWWQERTDVMESLAIKRAKKLFRSDHANVQALSGAAANLCIYWWLLQPWDTILWMDLTHWWHLTHGHPVTFISKIFPFVRYGMSDIATWRIDFDAMRALALEHKPAMILAWFSAYPRELDYERFAEIAHEVGAIAMADMSHIGWLIAWWVLKNPLDYWFHVMMTTTHKSLRWPRWALILSKGKVSNPLKKPEDTIENIPTRLDRSVFPGTQWWPHMHTIAGIAVALHEAAQPDFKEYAQQTLRNASAMADEFMCLSYSLVTWWTDNHMIILDFSADDTLNWSIAEKTLDAIGISTSKSTIPDDPNPPFRPSWLRIGTPAMTTRWMKEDEIKIIVWLMHDAFQHCDNHDYLAWLKKEITALSLQFPVPWL